MKTASTGFHTNDAPGSTDGPSLFSRTDERTDGRLVRNDELTNIKIYAKCDTLLPCILSEFSVFLTITLNIYLNLIGTCLL
jgi:hypothetical protein